MSSVDALQTPCNFEYDVIHTSRYTMQRQIAQQGPAIDRYMTQQQSLSQQTAGGMEFRDCQNPDASDGYVVGPDEKVLPSSAAARERAGFAVDEETACARRHEGGAACTV